MGNSNFVWLEDCTVLMCSEKAVQVQYDGTTYWLPLSQLADQVLYKVGSVYTIGVTEWLANDKGIEVE
jgi:hypothetical protein